jgi:hypothetical protein
MTEDQLQAKCWQWGWNTFPQVRRIFWAVPNGGDRNMVTAVKLQATGVIPGPHDLHLIWNGILWTFELKVGENQLTRDRTIITPSGREKLIFGQYEFGVAMVAQGGRWFEVRELEYFQNIFTKIILGKL